MLSVLLNSNIFKVSIKHIWQKRTDGVFYYRRRYPEQFREAMRKQGIDLPTFKVVSLKTKNKVEAARKIVQLAQADDREWSSALNGTPTSAVKADALKLIKAQGLLALPLSKQPNPEQAALAWDIFTDDLEQRVLRESQYRPHIDLEEHFDDFISPVERTAIEIVSGRYKFHLSDAKDHYIKTRSLDRKGIHATEASFRLITDVLGDRPIEDYRRAEVSTAIDAALASGLKTGSVSKRVGTVRAAVSELIRDEELEIKNPFEKHKIRGNGEDVDERN